MTNETSFTSEKRVRIITFQIIDELVSCRTRGAALWWGTASLFLASTENVIDMLPRVWVGAFISLVAHSQFSVVGLDACCTVSQDERDHDLKRPVAARDVQKLVVVLEQRLDNSPPPGGPQPPSEPQPRSHAA